MFLNKYVRPRNYSITKKEQYRSGTGCKTVASLCQKLIDKN